MAIPTLLELAEAGAHYGHHRCLLYPKARGSVYMIKNNIALIDLEKTQQQIEKAAQLFHQVKDSGGTVLFVGTRRLVRQVVEKLAKEVDSPYLTERWYGGFLTNFENFLKQIKAMNELEEYLQSGKIEKLDKKERLILTRKLHRLHRFLEGVKNLKKMPDLIILASSGEDKIALQEAKTIGVPTIAVADTDINPEDVTVPIPANDDAPRAVELILSSMINTKAAVKKRGASAKVKAGEKKKAKKSEAKKEAIKEKSSKTKTKVSTEKTTAKKTATKSKKEKK